MTCQECEQLIELYATDALERSERDKVRAHLATGCAKCLQALHEVEEILGLLALAQVNPNTFVPPRAKARLDALMGGESSPSLVPPSLAPAYSRADRPGAEVPEPVAVGAAERLELGLGADPLSAVGLKGEVSGARGGGLDGPPPTSIIVSSSGPAGRFTSGMRGGGFRGGDVNGGGPADKESLSGSYDEPYLHARRSLARRLLPLSIAAAVGVAITAGVMFTMLSSAGTHAEGLEKEIAAVRGAKEAADADLAALQARLDDTEKRLADVTEKSKGLQEQVDALTAKLEAANMQVGRLQAEQSRVRNLSERGAQQLQSAQAVLDMLSSRKLATVALEGQPASPDARARLLLDSEQKVWKLVGSNFTPLEGRVYVLWLNTAEGSSIAAGSFRPDSRGRCLLSDQMPSPMPEVVSVTITDEPSSDVTAPTGKLRLSGNLK